MWGVRAYVLARKGVLLSDESIAKMSPQRWLFEYMALSKKEKDDREFLIKGIKSVLVSTLGLNLLRPEDANGLPKATEEMTDEEKEGFIPLSIWMGNEGILDAVREQIEKVKINATELPPSSASYDAIVAAIDASDGDIEPIIGLDKLNIPTDAKVKQDNAKAGVLDASQIDTGDI